MEQQSHLENHDLVIEIIVIRNTNSGFSLSFLPPTNFSTSTVETHHELHVSIA